MVVEDCCRRRGDADCFSLQIVLPDDVTSATVAQQAAGLRTVIISYSVMTVLAGVLVLSFLYLKKPKSILRGYSVIILESLFCSKQPSTGSSLSSSFARIVDTKGWIIIQCLLSMLIE